MHAHALIHRDIKPTNILIDQDYRIKLIDFGFAILESDPNAQHTGKLIGTLGYIAPEGFNDGSYYLASDIWSAGIVLHEMLTGSPMDSRQVDDVSVAFFKIKLLLTIFSYRKLLLMIHIYPSQ